MQVGDLVLVSVDDHVVEPPTVFDNHVPKRFREYAPRLVRRDDDTEAWIYEGMELANIGLNAVVGRPRWEHGMEPCSLDEMRPGCYDVHSRVRDMDANGVLGALCFPSFPRFCGQIFLSGDRDMALAMVQAYNDWHVEEWCGAYPARFIPLALPVLWDAELMANEIRRLASKGCHAVTFSENPSKLGLPSLHSDYWNPVWTACSDVQTVVCMHIGSSSESLTTSEDAPVDVMLTIGALSIFRLASDLVWGPILRQFPDVKFALSEGGIGWVPSFLDRIDTVYKNHAAWTGQDYGDRLPSEVFNERVLLCYIDDRAGLESRHRFNLDNVMWECDYPHSDAPWPTAPEAVLADFQATHVSDSEINKITHENAIRHFNYDPFMIMDIPSATVSALRATAADWDIAERPMSRSSKVGTNSPANDLLHVGE